MRDARGHPQDLLQYLGMAVELLEGTLTVAYAMTLRAKKPESLAVMVMMTGSTGLAVGRHEPTMERML